MNVLFIYLIANIYKYDTSMLYKINILLFIYVCVYIIHIYVCAIYFNCIHG